jgi:hypothetical protein
MESDRERLERGEREREPVDMPVSQAGRWKGLTEKYGC